MRFEGIRCSFEINCDLDLGEIFNDFFWGGFTISMCRGTFSKEVNCNFSTQSSILAVTKSSIFYSLGPLLSNYSANSTIYC